MLRLASADWRADMVAFEPGNIDVVATWRGGRTMRKLRRDLIADRVNIFWFWPDRFRSLPNAARELRFSQGVALHAKNRGAVRCLNLLRLRLLQ
jgi:hypothetical protein